MEECGRGAAVEQLTACGMEYQSPRWGAIENANSKILFHNISIPAMGAIDFVCCRWHDIGVSIPAMGGNSLLYQSGAIMSSINPRNGGAIAELFDGLTPEKISIPAMGGNRIE